MVRVRFEPTIPVLERTKTVHGPDRAAAVIHPETSVSYSVVLLSERLSASEELCTIELPFSLIM
jgi:hypothetical protein